MAKQRSRAKSHRRSRKTNSRLAFNHAMMYVREIAPAVHFYVDLLGFKLIEQFPGAYARLRSPRGQSTLALHVLDPGQTLPGTDGVRLYLETKNVEEICRSLAVQGVTFSQEPKTMPWGWKHAYLKDPDGHEISLYWASAKRLAKTRMEG